MQRPQAPHQIHRVNPHHRPIGDQLADESECDPIVRIIERGHENGAIRDVEIGVARRKPLAVEVQGRGHRQRDDLDLPPVFEPHPLEPLAVLVQGAEVGVVGVGLAAQHHGPRVDEAAQIVHVPVGVVSRDALAEPQHIRHAQLVAERTLELGARQVRVPHLNRGVEQAFLGGQQRAATVHVDAPALEHHVAPARPSSKQPYPELLRCPLGDPVVLLPVGILRPGVEAESRDGELGPRGGAHHEQRTEITGPTPVGGEAEEFQARGIDTHLPEHASRPALVRRRTHENAHDLAGHQLADDLAIYPLDRRELSRPIARVVWPADPRGVVWLPLGGHAEPLRGGRGAIGHRLSAVSDLGRRADG